MKLLILEGCDKTGKTTMVASILNTILAAGKKAEGVHWPRPTATSKKENWSNWVMEVTQNLKQTDADVMIWDRSFIGNHIYGILREETQSLDFNGVMELLNYAEGIVDEIDIVLLQANYETLCKRFDEDKEDATAIEDITFLQWKYKILMEYLDSIAAFMPWPNVRIHILAEDADLTEAAEGLSEFYLNNL